MSLSNFDINLKISDWFVNLSHKNSNAVSNFSKAISICWQIWNGRNGCIFRKERHIHTRAFIRAMSMVNEYFKDNVKSWENTLVTSDDKVIKWNCPSYPYVKINFDGSVSNSLAAGGFIIRNWSGKPILAGAMSLGSSTINVAEAMALCEALIWARRRNLTHVCAEGDSKLIIDVVRGACETPWNLRSIIEDIR
nr:uncharacterized protein LOC103439107 [Malus domestica]